MDPKFPTTWALDLKNPSVDPLFDMLGLIG